MTSLSECQLTHDSLLNLCQLSMTSLMYRYRPTGFNSMPSECELSGGCGMVSVRDNHCATSVTLGQGVAAGMTRPSTLLLWREETVLFIPMRGVCYAC